MSSTHRFRLTARWNGWIEVGDSRRALTPGATGTPGDSTVNPKAFPGRWNPARAFPESLEPLPDVSGRALAAAGWWTPGSGEPSSNGLGGLIVGADGGYLSPSAKFTRQIASRYSPNVSPTDFIHSLPSTATALLAQLFGFTDYQATIVQGSLSGVVALSHAVDLLALGRLESALVTTSSVAPSLERDAPAMIARLAVAICLTPADHGNGANIELSIERTRERTRERTEGDEPPSRDDDVLAESLSPFGALAATPLVRLAIAIANTDESIEIRASANADGESVRLVARRL